jgi:GTPase SAR1 family protein
MRQLFKIVILGDGGVGKTTTIRNIYQYLSKKFPQSSFTTCQDDLVAIERTKFIDFHSINFLFNNHKIAWQIWDLQGQRFPSSKAYTSLNPLDHITETVIKSAHLILLVYDTTNNATFNEIFREQGFYDLIKPYMLDNQELLLLGNKTDITQQTDSVKKIETEITQTIAGSILYNNTFLENISTITETKLQVLKIPVDETVSIPTTSEESVSLKVYR